MTRWLAACAGIALLLLLPFGAMTDYYVNLSSQILIAAIFALSLNLLVGHAAYLGVAAYATAWLMLHTGIGHGFAAIGALAITTAMAGLYGVIALRASGLGFLMITLALGQILWGLAFRWVGVTGGDNGITVLTRPAPLGIDLTSPIAFYYFTLVFFAVAASCIAIFARSPFGACVRGARDQPRRMSALGHNVWMIRWITFVLAGFWGAVSGLLYVYYHKFISPHALSLTGSAEVLLMVIAGGPATLLGPIVGAALVVVVKNVVSGYIERWNFLLGAIFVAIVILMPEGLVPGTARLWRVGWRRFRRRRGAVLAQGPEPKS